MKKIFGAGHPRTGTAYTSQILNFLCPSVGHEEMKNNGVVSWFSIAQSPSMYNILYSGGWKPRFIPINFKDSINIQIYRNPLSCLNSIMYENTILNSYTFRNNIIGLDRYDNHTERALMSMIEWANFIKTQINIHYEFKVENGENELFDFIRSEKITKRSRDEFTDFITKLPRNVNHRPQSLQFNYNLNDISIESIQKLKTFSDNLGYTDNLMNPFVLNKSEQNLLSHYNDHESSYSCLNYCKLFDIFPHLPLSPDNMLDLGCGTGKILRTFIPHRYDGVDMSNIRINVAKNIFPQYVFHVQDINIYVKTAKEQYDLISIFETLEHLENPTALIENCKLLLNTGGTIIGSVPINLPYKAHLQLFRTTQDVEKLGVRVVYKDLKHFYFEYKNEAV